MGSIEEELYYENLLKKCVDFGRELRRNPHGHSADYMFYATNERKVTEIGSGSYYKTYSTAMKKRIIKDEMEKLTEFDHQLVKLNQLKGLVPDTYKYMLGKVCTDILNIALDKGLVTEINDSIRKQNGAFGLVQTLSDLSKKRLISFSETNEDEYIPIGFLTKLTDEYARGVKKTAMIYNSMYKNSYREILRRIEYGNIFTDDHLKNSLTSIQLGNRYNHNLDSSFKQVDKDSSFQESIRYNDLIESSKIR